MSQRKIFYPLLFLIFSFSGMSQIPHDYYISAEGVNDADLKTVLHNIIKDHTEYPYTSSNTDVWDILKETDRDTANPDNVILLYSGWSVNAAQEYNNGNGWTREHVWAKSHGDFGTSMGPGTDAHHLRPCDNTVNSARNNKDFDTGGTLYVDGDGPTECYSDADSWEPRDAVKGDVARMLFYMAVRYEGENGEPDLELVEQVDSYELNETGKGYHGKLSTLLEWHNQDPVDSFEINRNNVIYSFQHNRNPFIDHPEYVGRIWQLTSSGYYKPSTSVSIFPNPTNGIITVEIGDNKEYFFELFDFTGKRIYSRSISTLTKISLENYTKGIYLIKVRDTNKTIYSDKISLL